jgi:plasmid maintenance system antidote protein VapI
MNIHDYVLCSFDIKDMYTNIPTHETQNTVENIINKNHKVSHEMKIEIKNLLNIILKHNYTEHNRK